MYRKIILGFILNVIVSVLTCIVLKPTMFNRSLRHVPFGALGSYLVQEKPHQGYIFMSMICLYQCMEMYAHLIMYNEDYSWVDLEGYIIGHVYMTLYMGYIKNDENVL
jgi:hypothetical protein